MRILKKNVYFIKFLYFLYCEGKKAGGSDKKRKYNTNFSWGSILRVTSL